LRECQLGYKIGDKRKKEGHRKQVWTVIQQSNIKFSHVNNQQAGSSGIYIIYGTGTVYFWRVLRAFKITV
jgi:hypothetical protein